MKLTWGPWFPPNIKILPFWIAYLKNDLTWCTAKLIKFSTQLILVMEMKTKHGKINFQQLISVNFRLLWRIEWHGVSVYIMTIIWNAKPIRSRETAAKRKHSFLPNKKANVVSYREENFGKYWKIIQYSWAPPPTLYHEYFMSRYATICSRESKSSARWKQNPNNHNQFFF